MMALALAMAFSGKAIIARHKFNARITGTQGSVKNLSHYFGVENGATQLYEIAESPSEHPALMKLAMINRTPQVDHLPRGSRFVARGSNNVPTSRAVNAMGQQCIPLGLFDKGNVGTAVRGGFESKFVLSTHFPRPSAESSCPYRQATWDDRHGYGI